MRAVAHKFEGRKMEDSSLVLWHLQSAHCTCYWSEVIDFDAEPVYHRNEQICQLIDFSCSNARCLQCQNPPHASRTERLVVRSFCSDLHNNNASVAYLFGLDHKAIQHFLYESRWDHRRLREEPAKQIGSELGEFDGVITFDHSAFAKSVTSTLFLNPCGLVRTSG